MIRKTTFAMTAVLAAAATAASAAPIVTMTVQPSVVRSQVQGGGTYQVLDFNATLSDGSTFTNHEVIATALTGTLADPAKLQDDRQADDAAGEGNTAGSVDTYANTVMSAAAKESGFPATLVVNAGSYNPSGSGAAVPYTFLDWSVFDTANNDDNDLNDFPAADGGPFPVTAPYRIMRLLTSVGGSGTVQVRLFETAGQGVPSVFNFTYGSTIPEPATLSLLGLAMVGFVGVFRRR